MILSISTTLPRPLKCWLITILLPILSGKADMEMGSLSIHFSVHHPIVNDLLLSVRTMFCSSLSWRRDGW